MVFPIEAYYANEHLIGIAEDGQITEVTDGVANGVGAWHRADLGSRVESDRRIEHRYARHPVASRDPQQAQTDAGETRHQSR